jgi:hypothetical protein
MIPQTKQPVESFLGHFFPQQRRMIPVLPVLPSLLQISATPGIVQTHGINGNTASKVCVERENDEIMIPSSATPPGNIKNRYRLTINRLRLGSGSRCGAIGWVSSARSC